MISVLNSASCGPGSSLGQVIDALWSWTLLSYSAFPRYSELSPCGHPAITNTRYYGQNSDPHL